MEKAQFNFGDLVRVAGYGDRLFSVDGWRVVQYCYPDEEWTDVVYELADAHSEDWLEADVEDLTLVATADKAGEYLAQHEPIRKGSEMLMAFFGVDFARKPNVSPEIERYNKQRDRERRINELLDERNDYARLLAEFGDEEYKARIEKIDKELRKIE